MARRRGSDKPVERLRSGWTSDADLEETLASMFHQESVPGDKLTREALPTKPPDTIPEALSHSDPPDTLAATEPVNLAPPAPAGLTAPTPAILSGASPANLPGPPPVKLAAARPVSLTGPLYETLEGEVVDAKCIRPLEFVQNGHTPSEHAVYITMWRMLSNAGSDPDSREGLLPMRLIAAKVSLSVRNLRRVLHSLMDKLAVDVTEYEDKTKSIPRRYRVWSPKMVVERRRAAGYAYVYRNRNLITLAKPRVSLAPPTSHLDL